jgi:maltose O-acetyltransferase
VTIGARTVVGAGAVVTKDLPASVLAVGNPAKVIRELS